MKKRIKRTANGIATREQAANTVADIALLVGEIRLVTDTMSQEITEVRDRYNVDIDVLNSKLEVANERVYDWMERNPQEFGSKKSIEFPCGVVGWRMSPPALKTRRGWTWKTVLEKLMEDGIDRFIKVKHDVEKAKIIAERERLGDEELIKMGVEVVQVDEAFIEPKLEAAPV